MTKPTNPSKGKHRAEDIARALVSLESERTLVRTLADAAGIVILVLDADGRIVRLNHHLERLSGYRADELEGHDWVDTLVPTDDRDQMRTCFARALTGQPIAGHRNAIVDRHGGTHLIEWHDTPLTDREHALIGILTIGEDVTDREAATRALQESEARLRAVLNTAVEGIITIDATGRIETANDAAQRMFGYARAELVGQNVSILAAEPHGSRHDTYIQNFLRTGEAKIIGSGREVEGRRKDGSIFPIGLAVSEFRDGTSSKFAGIIRDLTAQKRAEEKLRQADRLATIGTVVAGLGHDMNNVLLPVRSRLDVLEAQTLPEIAIEQISAIRQSIGYLQHLSDSLRLLSLDPADAEASTGVTDVARWWAQVRPLLERSVPPHVRLTTEFEADLPTIAIAQHRLTQVVLNLLVNSGEAVGPEGKVQLWARRARGDFVAIGVTDDGEGMTAETRRRALDPFFTTKTRGLGTGLGLSLVTSIVTSCGGTIDIDSEPARGTTVRVVLPPAPPDDLRAASHRYRATVRLPDARSAAIVTSVLETAGVTIEHDTTSEDVDIRVVEGAAVHDDAGVRRFGERATGVLVICGEDRPRWAGAGTILIENVSDFEQVRDGVGFAISALMEAGA